MLSLVSAMLLMVLWSAGILSAQTPDDTEAQILWLKNDQLWLNNTPIVTNNVLDARLSPDGTYIAYVTIPQGDTPMQLVIYEHGGESAAVTIDAAELPPFEETVIQFATPRWLDHETLVFTTFAALPGPGGVLPLLDIWQLRIDGTLSEIRLRGEGGYLTPSPDGSLIAVVNPGVYPSTSERGVAVTAEPATVEIVNSITFAPITDVFSFPAVASGTEVPYVAPIQWAADSTTAAFAIPDPELAYTLLDNGVIPDSQLCRISITTTAQCDTVQLGFPVRPVWSTDLQQVAFQRSAGVNIWEVVINSEERTIILPTTTALPEPLLWIGDELLFREVTLQGTVYAWVSNGAQTVWDIPIIDAQPLGDGQLAVIVGTPTGYSVQIYHRLSDTFIEVASATDGFPRLVANN